MKRKSIIVCIVLGQLVLMSACNENAIEESSQDRYPNRDDDQMVENLSSDEYYNYTNKPTQRDYGWHNNRLTPAKTGKFKGRPNSHAHPDALLHEAEQINDRIEQTDTGEDAANIKYKLEKLHPVYSAYVVELNGRFFIGLESETEDKLQMNRAIQEIVNAERNDAQYEWFTDRGAVNRIRAAERAEHPNQERHLDDWFHEMEYELQKRGKGWLD
ncbi:YhcN/YlaJ family sporulation lipoprotein [Geomicrobium sp. JCM 19037]|uniref:YhcN/YlaJ family sporulation lipoprotein n=1 Tax=Geomicrobium sp. JCM 19037 TaxID=1460634 RepID=UPI0005A74033|nr:YhcN/YlaJ family sporulation lipoprotein [Geomicrobium sp. JCM 19037]